MLNLANSRLKYNNDNRWGDITGLQSNLVSDPLKPRDVVYWYIIYVINSGGGFC